LLWDTIAFMSRSVLISGGSRGIGKATAELLSAEGYQVYAPGSAEMDVASQDSVDNYSSGLLRFARNDQSSRGAQRRGDPCLDALVLNAGIFHSAPITDYKLNDWQRVIDVNLHGVFRVLTAVLPLMTLNDGKRRQIVIISSVSARGEAYASAYSASKAALIAAAKAWAVELAKYKINVNVISPGWVRTDMALGILSTPEQQRDELGATLTGKWIEPEEIASMVAYLLSDAGRSITGAEMVVGAGI
jgi:NAD(P)-dependent dehydrogenase (short-subunit alcohol dehydrogenase family)